MTFKKGLHMTFFLILIGSLLGGCSSGNGEEGGTVTLKIWGMGEEAKSLPELAKIFEEENPGIRVKVQALPWDNAHDKLLTAVASRGGPDIIQMGTTWVPEIASAKALLDLTPYVDKYPELNPDNFYEGAVQTTKYEDTFVGVPWYIDTRVLYYRTDLLKEAGYETPPGTWDELKDAASKLAKRGNDKYGISLDTAEQTLGFMFARQNGSKLIEGDKTLFNEKPYVEAIEYLESFFREGLAPKDLGLDAIQAFAGEGTIPMFISGPWMIKLINDQAPDLKGKWATAVLPKKVTNESLLGGADLSIFQYSKHKEEALKFLAFMSRPQTQLKWMEMTQSFPSVKKAWEDEKLKSDPNFQVIGKQAENASPMPRIVSWEEISQGYKKAFEKIYRRGDNVQQVMDDYNANATRILNR
ncbi:sugar ABC transporter substrate-binding protein [Paenibacillus nasutitermitis]|uniref:Sugar ABC transporter substrate-binding protein n=1 Tax=Paenibacillus nasutitermitis TaxID=1652958 RepID=A0A916ZF10_9BACL|nr:sugar ABC transporter substrate-binding protein [Paenibacillus nasutitermitis]GGD93188.1 sugar ABC transporter substrate-binding protein [Paenibacillus nasutitermitis]